MAYMACELSRPLGVLGNSLNFILEGIGGGVLRNSLNFIFEGHTHTHYTHTHTKKSPRSRGPREQP